jgi:hypothetical protein
MDHSAFAKVRITKLGQFVPGHNPVKIGFFLFFPTFRFPGSVGCQPKGATALFAVVCRSSGFRVNRPTKNTLLTDLFMSSHLLSISAILHILFLPHVSVR